MRSIAEIHADVGRQVRLQMQATVEHRSTLDRDSARAMADTYLDLPPILREAVELHDIDLMLRVELIFMELELEYIAHDSRHLQSLNRGIQQATDAIRMLAFVNDPDAYQLAGIFYGLSRDTIRNTGLPKDAVHKFLDSHKKRLANWKNPHISESLTQLYNTRIWCIQQTQEMYKARQREVLVVGDAGGQVSPPSASRNPLPANPGSYEPPQGIREPHKHYRVDQDRKQAA